MRRELILVLCVGMVAAPLFLMMSAWAADEECTDTTQCSQEIAVTNSNSKITIPWPTTELCVQNKVGSDTVYVRFDDTDATVDADHSHPMLASEILCFGDQRSFTELNVISAPAETGTFQVLAIKVR